MEHAATVLARLAPIGENASAIKHAGGIAPLVALLSEGGTVAAKEQSANTLAQLARSASAAVEIAEAGGISALIHWLVVPADGPAGVAARALSEIALDNCDTHRAPLGIRKDGSRSCGGYGPAAGMHAERGDGRPMAKEMALQAGRG